MDRRIATSDTCTLLLNRHKRPTLKFADQEISIRRSQSIGSLRSRHMRLRLHIRRPVNNVPLVFLVPLNRRPPLLVIIQPHSSLPISENVLEKMVIAHPNSTEYRPCNSHQPSRCATFVICEFAVQAKDEADDGEPEEPEDDSADALALGGHPVGAEFVEVGFVFRGDVVLVCAVGDEFYVAG